MRDARLQKFEPVIFGLCARYGQMDVGPDDEKAVEHVNHSGHVGDDVVGQGVGFGAGQLIDDQVHAEELLDFGAAQLQRGGQNNTQGEEAEGHEPGGAHQGPQPPPGHEGAVLQRLTDGQISVIGHDGQDGHLAAGEGVHDEGLQQAALVGDFMGGGQEVGEEFREEARGPVKAVDAEAAQEDVHGLVQAFIEGDDGDEADVDEEDQAVVQKRDREDGHSVIHGLVQPGEYENPDGGGVVHDQGR